jgi:hypothetical protein
VREKSGLFEDPPVTITTRVTGALARAAEIAGRALARYAQWPRRVLRRLGWSWARHLAGQSCFNSFLLLGETATADLC